MVVLGERGADVVPDPVRVRVAVDEQDRRTGRLATLDDSELNAIPGGDDAPCFVHHKSSTTLSTGQAGAYPDGRATTADRWGRISAPNGPRSWNRPGRLALTQTAARRAGGGLVRLPGVGYGC
jgi:hypothetical protein